jgi:hypothetical protein
MCLPDPSVLGGVALEASTHHDVIFLDRKLVCQESFDLALRAHIRTLAERVVQTASAEGLG